MVKRGLINKLFQIKLILCLWSLYVIMAVPAKNQENSSDIDLRSSGTPCSYPKKSIMPYLIVARFWALS